MGKKSNARTATADVSRMATSNAAGTKAAILKSSFAPTPFQLQLFASVIQSFDSQQLRLHDTSSGRLRQQHAITPGTEITSLTWGHYTSSSHRDQPSKKKRKRTQGTPEDAVVAYSTSASEVCMYSPAEGRVVGTLSGAHERGIRDFRFRWDDTTEAWSIGGDERLVQWDLSTNTAVRTIPLSDPSVTILAQPVANQPQVICASSKPLSIDTSSDTVRIDVYDAFKNPIHSIVRSGKTQGSVSEAFIAADQDRYLNIFDVEQKKLVRTLVVGSDVQHIDLFSPSDDHKLFQEQLLAVVTRDGLVELFPRPFDQANMVNGDLKSKRKSMTRKAQAQIKLLRAGSRVPVPIYTTSLRGSYIIIVSVDAGVEPIFQKIRWQDEGTNELLFDGVKEVVQTQISSALNSAHVNGVKDVSKAQIDDSQTVLVNGNGELGSTNDAVEILSDDEDNGTESDSEAENEEISDDEDALDEVDDAGALVQREEDESDSDEEMVDAVAGNEEPSFGDMLASKHPETISISNSLTLQLDADQSTTQQLAVPVGMSLGTVLTQALKSNDNNLLESCLHANDNGIIQNTIQRLDSSLAAILLSKLAERLASRPGRYGHLLSWVQWTCIAHGGAIAGQPDVAAKLKTLYRVLNQRSSSLDQLLLLKGKLDMLEAQLAFRKQLQAQKGDDARDSNEPGMIYIEGEEDNWSSEDDHDEAVGVPKKLGFKTKVPLKKSSITLTDMSSDEEDEEDEDDDMPTTNGVAPGDGAEEDDDEEEEDLSSDSEIDATGRRRKGLVDIQADVSGEDQPESDSDASDAEEEEDEDEDEDEDSSMDDFINDGEISEASSSDEEIKPRRPATKKSKHR